MWNVPAEVAQASTGTGLGAQQLPGAAVPQLCCIQWSVGAIRLRRRTGNMEYALDVSIIQQLVQALDYRTTGER